MNAEIVETSFVYSHFLENRKETTSFPIVPKINDKKLGLFLASSRFFPEMTGNDLIRGWSGGRVVGRAQPK